MWQDLSEDIIDARVTYFSGHKGEVNCCAFSPDCQLVLTCSDDGCLYLWKASNGKLMAKIRGHTGHLRSVETVAFSPDGRNLVSGGWDNTVLLWDIQTGLKVRQFNGHSAAVQSSAISTDSQYLATGSWDHSVKVWSLSNDKEVVTLTGHSGNVACLCFSTTGMLASGSWDGSVRVWSLQRHECVFVLAVGERVWVRCVTFCENGTLLATTAEGEKVKIWDMADGKCIKCLYGHKDSAYGVYLALAGPLSLVALTC